MGSARIHHSPSRQCATYVDCSRDKPKTLAMRARNSVNRFFAQVRSLFSRSLEAMKPAPKFVARRSCTSDERAKFLRSEIRQEEAVKSLLARARLPAPPAGLSLAETKIFKERQFEILEKKQREMSRDIEVMKNNLRALRTD
jgi:hypothetical protein